MQKFKAIISVGDEVSRIEISESSRAIFISEADYLLLKSFSKWYSEGLRILHDNKHEKLPELDVSFEDLFFEIEGDIFKFRFEFCYNQLVGESIYTLDGKVVMMRDMIDILPNIGSGFAESLSDIVAHKVPEINHLSTAELTSLPVLSYLIGANLLPKLNFITSENLPRKDEVKEEYFRVVNRVMPSLFSQENIKEISEKYVIVSTAGGKLVRFSIEDMGSGFHQVLRILLFAVNCKYYEDILVLHDWKSSLHPVLANAIKDIFKEENIKKWKGALVLSSWR